MSLYEGPATITAQGVEPVPVTVSLVASEATAYELPSWRGRARVEPPASLWEAFNRGGAVLTIGDRSGDIVIDSPGEVWSELTGSGDPPF